MSSIIGIGEYKISNDPMAKIVTYALASCVAVTAYCPSKRISGMVHVALPAPARNEDGIAGPCYYAITGVPLMIGRMCREYDCWEKELVIRLFGGADSIRKNDVFKLGKINIQMVKQVLANMSLSYDAVHTGGFVSRTLEMCTATGKIKIKEQPLYI